MAAPIIHFDLDSPYELAKEQIRFYRENGFVRLKKVLPAEVLEHYRNEISAKVQELNTERLPLEQRSVYGRAFLQVTNLWTKSEIVKEFVTGKRLARIAAELMGCRGVRLYHDQALYKEPGGGFTPWHADQYYWPVNTDNIVTAWIPLQDTPVEMGTPAFSPGSFRIQEGRDLEIGEDSETRLQTTLKEYGVDEGPFALGDVSFHSGWTFHRAGPNQTVRPREAMTIIYMDLDARLIQPKNKHQEADRQAWCPGVGIGQIIDSPLNLVLYSR
ncbi:MAG: phytanoyl-CoA dioxygenase [Acidobacteria bacterium]|nr:MAG: phytanoyl-CoA dioxygenase [Acidobacteriota bacterium]